jgi:DhnA family fructose-bisphosphate aldolase class Ia
VIQIASPKPVLVRGGGKASEEEIMQRTYQLMKQGAKGIVYLY